VITVLIGIVAVTAVAGIGFAFAVRRLPRLSLQLAALAVFAVGLPMVSVAVSGVVMLGPEEAREVLVLTSVAALGASLTALLIAGGITRPLQNLHDAATDIAAGDLDTRLAVGGPAELSELAEAFNTMAANTKRTFDARSDFIAWASHDLRSPVASLQAMVEAIQDGVTPPERYLPAIQERIGDLARLVEDLFDYARIEIEAPVATPTTDLVGIAARAVATHQPQAATQRITITLHTDRPDIAARCAATDLARVLDNLLANALHHTPAGGNIHVTVHRDAIIMVTDSGPGFPAEALDRVFEPFWRGDLSRHTSGAGLGLAIARGLLERNGATITATNAPGARLTISCQPATVQGNHAESAPASPVISR
jgi:two-component system sensor histidine kinase BaeS